MHLDVCEAHMSKGNEPGCYVQMYLPATALDIVNITTAKSSEVNVAVSGMADDLLEHPIPEQFVSIFRKGKLITEPVSHGGG